MIEKNEMIFGVRAVIEAIQAGKEIDKVLIKKDIQSDLSKELFAVLKDTFIPVQRVPVERINRITKKNHQGVVAFISPITYQRTEDIVPFLFEQGKNPLLILLDGLTDVRTSEPLPVRVNVPVWMPSSFRQKTVSVSMRMPSRPLPEPCIPFRCAARTT